MENILYLILGWLFGLLGPQIINSISKRYHKNDIKNSIISELKEVSIRLVMNYFQIMLNYGSLDKPILIWIKHHMDNYHGAYPTSKISEDIKKMLELDDKMLQDAIEKTQDGTNLYLKTYFLPFLESKTSYLLLFSSKSQLSISEIRSDLNIINEDILYSRKLFFLTFNSLSPDNHKIVNINLKNTYLDTAKHSKYLIENIDNLELK
ncbi:MAG: hypothetical protein LHV68_12810 [Elusimicrobia bacterium]|nr:hypothetical protein [Candidatus Liberimonas magnetica]